MFAVSTGARPPALSFTDDVDVDDAPDRYGYPFEWRDRKFQPVPVSWLIHGQVPETPRRSTWLAASTAYDDRLDVVVVRYAPVDAEVDAVRVEQFDPAGPPGGRYPKAIESGRWPTVLFNTFAPTIDRIRLSEREYVRAVVDAAGGDGR